MKKYVCIFCIFISFTLYAQIYIEQWGLADYHGWPILNDITTLPGYASIGGDTRDGWASLRGSFGQDVAISKDTAIVVSGQIEFIGGSGGDDSMPIRYALTYQTNEGEILYAGTDSAQWSVNGEHYGYSFHPRTGKGTMSNGYNGEGTVWTINNGNWCSTYSNNGWPIDAINQLPRNAEIVTGIYDFAISVQTIDDTTNEIRWYMVEEQSKYFFFGVVRDTAMTTKFNGIEFGINGGEYTRFNVIGMSVDIGDSIPNYPPGPYTYYVNSWDFIGDQSGGWTTTPGDLYGNFSISGDNPNTEMVSILGILDGYHALFSSDTLVIKGTLEFVNGGFEAANSLRLGLFAHPDLPSGSLWKSTLLDSISENEYSGFLFIPPSGSNEPACWGETGESGSCGVIYNNIWFEPHADSNYVLCNGKKYPENAVASEGIYNFEISFSRNGYDNTEIHFSFINESETYGFAGMTIDSMNYTDMDYFNCMTISLDSGNASTALHLRDISYIKGNHIELPYWVTSVKQTENSIPSKFSLSQNYPNPFNPFTIIKYGLKEDRHVEISIYNMLGQKVKKLVSEFQSAGYKQVIWNGTNEEGKKMTSGLYIYRIEAGDFVDTKKMLLLK